MWFADLRLKYILREWKLKRRENYRAILKIIAPSLLNMWVTNSALILSTFYVLHIDIQHVPTCTSSLSYCYTPTWTCSQCICCIMLVSNFWVKVLGLKLGGAVEILWVLFHWLWAPLIATRLGLWELELKINRKNCGKIAEDLSYLLFVNEGTTLFNSCNMVSCLCI